MLDRLLSYIAQRKAKAARKRKRADKRARKALAAERYRAEWTGDQCWCPVCERPARAFADVPRGGSRRARCPWCFSRMRHRFAWLFLQRRTDLFDGSPKRVLHFAPEPFFEPLFRRLLGAGYTTCDLMNPEVDLQADITALPLPDGGFDMIYCSHVLEHVVEDRKAMRELRRVLKPGGWALVSVPIMTETTIEDPSVTDPAERERLYGQHDHVRIYGKDFAGRLREAGFELEVYLAPELFTREERDRMGLGRSCGEIFICRKPAMHQATP